MATRRIIHADFDADISNFDHSFSVRMSDASTQFNLQIGNMIAGPLPVSAIPEYIDALETAYRWNTALTEAEEEGNGSA